MGSIRNRAPRLVLTLAVALLVPLAPGRGQAPRPNVVVLLADDLGFRDIGCYGGPVETPHLDALAAAGTRFSDFYSGCAVCSPSRATLLTGRHHIRAGVYSWIDDPSQRSHLLERDLSGEMPERTARMRARLLEINTSVMADGAGWHQAAP